jgi:hypothetical protein
MIRTLLMLTAAIETATGLALLASPPLTAGLLLGTSLDGAAAAIVGRIAGAALLSLGVAFWLARDDGPSRAVLGLINAMLVYNCAAVAVLAYAGAGVGLAGVLLWPAVVLHSVLAIWCVWCMRGDTIGGGARQIARARA